MLSECPGMPVVVASDSEVVLDAVGDLEVDAVLTGAARTGSDRVAGVARLGRYRDAEIVVNVQGDEPFVTGLEIEAAVEMAVRGFDIGTTASVLEPDEWDVGDVVKVLVGESDRAVWFGRRRAFPAPMPPGRILKHHGIYAYRREGLARFQALASSPSECAEGLEQLRALEEGLTIGVQEVPSRYGGIDTVGDLILAETLLGRTSERV